MLLASTHFNSTRRVGSDYRGSTIELIYITKLNFEVFFRFGNPKRVPSVELLNFYNV